MCMGSAECGHETLFELRFKKAQTVMTVCFGRVLSTDERRDILNEMKFQVRQRGSKWDKALIRMTTRKMKRKGSRI